MEPPKRRTSEVAHQRSGCATKRRVARYGLDGRMFGSHLSIAGGLHHAVSAARDLGFDSVQLFTKNQQQWQVKPLDPAAGGRFTAELDRCGIQSPVAHDSYLINLAASDQEVRRRSIDLFSEEIRRCDALGIGLLVSHPGCHMGTRDDVDDERDGIERVVTALNQLLAAGKVTVCLEATAGQGTSIGHRLEHLSTIIKLCERSSRLGICLDTAHLFAAGYDWRGRKYPGFLRGIDQTIGLDRVKVWHINDSKKPLASRVDRHEHIGLGQIGLDGFSPIVRDRRWSGVPKILETAKEKHPSGLQWDAVNLATLRGLMK